MSPGQGRKKPKHGRLVTCVQGLGEKQQGLKRTKKEKDFKIEQSALDGSTNWLTIRQTSGMMMEVAAKITINPNLVESMQYLTICGVNIKLKLRDNFMSP